jgi:hypothetical protein
VKGRWAAGIEPRGFTWVFRDQLAVAERPGGSTTVHRAVRRDEELRWLRQRGFTRVISILPEANSLSPYTEHGMSAAHYPLRGGPRQDSVLASCFSDLAACEDANTTVLLHSDEVSDRLLGLVAGYLIWRGKVATPSVALAATERLFKRSVGPDGKALLWQLPSSS